MPEIEVYQLSSNDKLWCYDGATGEAWWVWRRTGRRSGGSKYTLESIPSRGGVRVYPKWLELAVAPGL